MIAVGKREGLSRGRVTAWVLLLALGQVADLVTTQAAMAHGALEGNAIARVIMGAGGLGLLLVVKAALVAAMALSIWLVKRYWDVTRDQRSMLAATLVWRGLQLCVVVLAVTAINNFSVLRSMSS